MIPYASPDDLQPWIAFYGVPFPADPERLIMLATLDVQRHVGAPWDPLLLPADDVQALRDATAIQCCFRAGQGIDSGLGVDDGLSSVGPLAFSTRSIPRFSPEAAEMLSGRGLYARSGTLPPEITILDAEA